MFLAIIQARMTSTRLPGKVMKQVLGKPIIGYLLERLSQSHKIDKIILATTTNPEDNVLSEFVESEGYPVFRGSENDVLERYYLAAEWLKTDHIVRITGDCPCIDPFICDRLVDEFIKQNADYATLSPQYPEGTDCEIFTFKLLKDAYRYAKLDSEREHVSLYFKNNRDIYNNIILDSITDDSRYRFTVDQKEDFIVIRSIIEALYKNGTPIFTLQDIKAYLDINPDVFNLNKHITRNEGLLKSLRNDSLTKESFS